MRTLFSLTLATVLFAVVAAQVNAQQEGQNRQGGQRGQGQRGQGQGQGQRGQGQRGQGQRGPGGRGGGGIAGLLRMEEVQKEIELLDEQLADIEKLQEKLRSERGNGQRSQGDGERRNFQDLSEEERAKLRQEYEARQRAQNKETEALLSEILLPHQMDRLKELSLQLAGARALMGEEVAGKLGVSDEKRKELAEVLGSMRERMGAIFQRGGQGDGERPSREEMMAKFQEVNKEIEKEALAKLTDSQREKFASMKGKPFKFPQPNFGGGRPGGGRPGGGDNAGRGDNASGGRRPQRPASDE